jgi:hypothetical protein
LHFQLGLLNNYYSNHIPAEISSIIPTVIESYRTAWIYAQQSLDMAHIQYFYDVPGMLNDLALMEIGSGNIDTGIQLLRAALSLDPERVSLLGNLAGILSDLTIYSYVEVNGTWGYISSEEEANLLYKRAIVAAAGTAQESILLHNYGVFR